MSTTFQSLPLKFNTALNMRIATYLTIILAVISFDAIIASYCNWAVEIFIALVLGEGAMYLWHKLKQREKKWRNPLCNEELEFYNKERGIKVENFWTDEIILN